MGTERPCDEADQERLAMEAHDGANKGKKGLGVGSHVMSNPKNMAAGSNWEGKKMSFDDTGGQSSEAGFDHSHSFIC